MLILTRSPETSIVIQCPNGDEIEIRHCGYRSDQTRFGFNAPREYRIMRGELLEEQVETSS